MSRMSPRRKSWTTRGVYLFRVLALPATSGHSFANQLTTELNHRLLTSTSNHVKLNRHSSDLTSAEISDPSHRCAADVNATVPGPRYVAVTDWYGDPTVSLNGGTTARSSACAQRRKDNILRRNEFE